MAYSSDITKTLTDQITKFVTLNAHQLAGHIELTWTSGWLRCGTALMSSMGTIAGSSR
jgi:hypothetical protein